MATQQIDQEKLEAFVERIVLDVGTAMRGGLVYIGDRLGIYKAMADAGPVTVAQLPIEDPFSVLYELKA